MISYSQYEHIPQLVQDTNLDRLGFEPITKRKHLLSKCLVLVLLNVFNHVKKALLSSIFF